MAKIWFRTADGDERAYKLDQNRILRIGRDPANDIVLRDARVSRQHAQIVFERGFFVLHDLTSSNGSYVNDQRVRVAPLTDGAQLRLGNSIGRFSEELPPKDEGPSPTVSFDPLERSGDHDEPVENIDSMMTRPLETMNPDDLPPADPEGNGLETKPHQRAGVSPADDELSEQITDEGPMEDSSSPSASADSTMLDDVRTEPVVPARSPFSYTRYSVETGPPDSERGVVTDEAAKPLFYFRRIADLVGCTAAMVTVITLVSGLTATFLLLFEVRIIPALLALALTVCFTWLITLLVPRRHLVLYDDEMLTSPALLVEQISRFGFPSLRYSVRTLDGPPLAVLQRNVLSRVVRHRWWILDPNGYAATGFAIESSLSRAILHNFLGNFFGMLRTDFVIYAGGVEVGRILRSDARAARIDMSADIRAAVDRRVVLAIALVIDAVEK